MSQSLEDRVVVITGASGGIGAAVARAVAREGTCVALAARREEELESVAAEIGGERRVLALVTDVTRRKDVDRLKEVTLDRFGRIDVWINNAGRGITRSVL